MANGEIKVSGNDVFEALTRCDAATKYQRILNSEGEELANLIVERVLNLLKAKLNAELPED